MITITCGNLLTSSAEALVNTVNTVGVMGKGIALQFKKAFPENYEAYAVACKRGEVIPGKMFVTKANRIGGPKLIINFPTKRHWKGKSKIEDIESGLKDLVRVVVDANIKSIAIPPLGCGLGGLSWATVKSMIESTFSVLPEIDVQLYEPNGAPRAESMPNNTEAPPMTPGRAALLSIMMRYNQRAISVGVTVIEAQKLCYFLQLAGEPLRLRYQKWHYGPYADNLRHVISSLDGHYLRGWGDGNGRPLAQLVVIHQPREIALPSDTKSRIERVLELVDGFEDPHDMELLATVHWIAQNELGERQITIEAIRDHIAKWTNRKNKLFQEAHINAALSRLREFDFIH